MRTSRSKVINLSWKYVVATSGKKLRSKTLQWPLATQRSYRTSWKQVFFFKSWKVTYTTHRPVKEGNRLKWRRNVLAYGEEGDNEWVNEDRGRVGTQLLFAVIQVQIWVGRLFPPIKFKDGMLLGSLPVPSTPLPWIINSNPRSVGYWEYN
jgi:hypothetical protein